MAITVFKPEVWAARLQRHLDKKLVYAQPTVVNTDYEGDITQGGDTVHIQKVGDVTVKAYSKNTDMASPDRPDGTTVPLVIDQSWYWNIGIDDIDKVQLRTDLLDRFAERAAVAMAQKVDAAVAAKQLTDAGIVLGTSAAPKTVQNSGGDYTLYTLLVELRRQLDNANAPDTGRWVVLPPDMESLALKDTQFIDAGGEQMRTGIVGRMAGFDILKTTAVPTITKTGGATYDSWGVVAGAGNYSTTHANQIVETEAYRIEKQFGDALKGLNVWGTKVIEPETLAKVVVSKGA